MKTHWLDGLLFSVYNCMLAHCTPTTTFFLVIGIYFEACSHHFQTTFANINKLVDDEYEPIEVRLKLKRSLIEAVNFHRSAKRYERLYDYHSHNPLNALTTFSIFESARVLMRATIFFELFVGILFMSIVNSSLGVVRTEFKPSYQSCSACKLFAFLTQAATNLDLNIVVVILGVQCNTGTVFLYCYVGSLTMNQFHRYGDISYEAQWIKMPIELRKFVQIVIADAQRLLKFTKLNLVDLNLTAFTTVRFCFHIFCYRYLLCALLCFQVMKAVVTYYMMFRSLAKYSHYIDDWDS